MNTKLLRRWADVLASTLWKLAHPNTCSRFGIVFNIDSWVVPYYLIRSSTFKRLLPIFDNYVENSGVVLDVGASFGFYSLYCAKRLRAKQVLAFEPTMRAYNLLIDNLKRNNVNTVLTYRCAVGEDKGIIKLNYSLLNSGGNSIVGYDSKRYEWVDVFRVDSLISSRVDFVKIDVEGAELSVLKGMKKLITKYTPPILLEISMDKEKIENLLTERGYVLAAKVGHNFLALHKKDLRTLPELDLKYSGFTKENKFKYKKLI